MRGPVGQQGQTGSSYNAYVPLKHTHAIDLYVHKHGGRVLSKHLHVDKYDSFTFFCLCRRVDPELAMRIDPG